MRGTLQSAAVGNHQWKEKTKDTARKLELGRKESGDKKNLFTSSSGNIEDTTRVPLICTEIILGDFNLWLTLN